MKYYHWLENLIMSEIIITIINVLQNLKILTNHIISSRRTDLVIFKNTIKRTCRIVDIPVPVDDGVKNRKQKER